MKRGLGLLIAGTVAVWLLVAYPASLWWGSSALLFSATAGLLCLAPAVATLLWSLRAFHGLPEQQLLAVMGGMGARVVVVVGAGMVLYFGVPEFHYLRFWLWVVAFYLVTLSLEMAALLTSPVMKGDPRNG